MASTRGKKTTTEAAVEAEAAEDSTGGRRVTRSSIRCATKSVAKSEDAAPATPKRKARPPVKKDEAIEVAEEDEVAADKSKRTKKSSRKKPHEDNEEVSDAEIVSNQRVDERKYVEEKSPSKNVRSPQKEVKEPSPQKPSPQKVVKEPSPQKPSPQKPSPQKVVKAASSQKRENAAIEDDSDSDSDSAPEDVGFSASRVAALESLALQRSLAKALDKRIKEDRQRMHERNLEQKKQKKVKLDEVCEREPKISGEVQFTKLKERPSVTRLDRPSFGPKLPPGMHIELSSKRLPLAAAVSQAVLSFRNNRLYGEGSGIQRESMDVSMARKRKMITNALHK